jgi:DNA-binding response OmpR family regulator
MLACQKEKPDLVILDIELADGLTYELAQKLLDDDVPVILHSERYEAHELAVRFPQAATVTKPCPPAEMLRLVSQVLAPA